MECRQTKTRQTKNRTLGNTTGAGIRGIETTVKMLVHALIASRLDYCNSVFYQLSAANLQALQSVLNAGARLHHAKVEIQPHHINITRRFTLAAHSSANNVQAEHHCLQVSK